MAVFVVSWNKFVNTSMLALSIVLADFVDADEVKLSK